VSEEARQAELEAESIEEPLGPSAVRDTLVGGAEGAARCVGARVHGPGRDAEREGDVVGARSLDLDEEEHEPSLGLELLERARDALEALLDLGADQRIPCARRYRGDRGLVAHGGLAAAAAPDVRGDADRDLGEEGGLGGWAFGEAAAAEHHEEDLLNGVVELRPRNAQARELTRDEGGPLAEELGRAA
jgi:hypothetical protein